MEFNKNPKKVLSSLKFSEDKLARDFQLQSSISQNQDKSADKNSKEIKNKNKKVASNAPTSIYQSENKWATERKKIASLPNEVIVATAKYFDDDQIFWCLSLVNEQFNLAGTELMFSGKSFRFDRYEQIVESGRVSVQRKVLFGDCKDTDLRVLNLPPTKSEGGTIRFQIKHGIDTFPGEYIHSKFYLKGGQSVHLIHHSNVDGEKLARWLCLVGGHSGLWNPNIISRYDWCHYRNWGTCDEELMSERSDGESDDEDEEQEEKEYEERTKMYFVSAICQDKADHDGPKVSGTTAKELGRFCLSSDVIEGDWHYGLRITDPRTKYCYAFTFGDALVNDELAGDVDEDDLLNPKGFEVSVLRFALPESAKELKNCQKQLSKLSESHS